MHCPVINTRALALEQSLIQIIEDTVLHSFRFKGKVMIDWRNLRFITIFLTYKTEIFFILSYQKIILHFMRRKGWGAVKVMGKWGRKYLRRWH